MICLDEQTGGCVVQAEVAIVQPAVAERVALQGLTIQLGPDLRTTYPVVMNFNISGQVNVTGPADPQRLQLQGTIKLDSGEVTHSPCSRTPTWPHLTLLQNLPAMCCMPVCRVRAVLADSMHCTEPCSTMLLLSVTLWQIQTVVEVMLRTCFLTPFFLI